jgi:glycerol-3-phosphate acyltransferase PlsY
MTVHDIDKAEATYGGFMTALKWAVPVIALIVLFVVMLIAG